jgi:Domain of unknown function (DUF4350)
MGSLRSYRVTLVIAILLLVGIAVMLVKPAPPTYPPYVAKSAQADGSKAIVMLMEEKGKRVKEWRQPMKLLPDHGGQVLVSLEPRGMTEGEREELLDWVALGNDWILLEGEPADWEDASFQFLEVEEYEEKERQLSGLEVHGTMKGSARTPVRFIENPDVEALLTDDEGILAGRTQIGDGSVSLFLVPEWMTNKGIAQHDHFEAIWPNLQENWSVIWVDEYHHGYREQPGMLTLYPGWLIAGFAQLGLLLLLWIWWCGKRFGPIYTLREWTVRRGDETLIAVSSWYERRRLALDALRHREAYMRQLMYERWGVHYHAEQHEIISVARNKWNESEVEDLIQGLQRLEVAKAEKSYTPRQLLADSLLLDKILKHLEKE